MRKVIYLVPPNARISEVAVSGGAGTTPQPADTPSATPTAASVETDTTPPAYDHNAGLETEHVDIVEKN